MLTASDPTDGSTVLTVSTLLLTLLLVALIFERVVHFFGPFWRQSIRMLHSRYATLGPPDLTHDDPEQQLNTQTTLKMSVSATSIVGSTPIRLPHLSHSSFAIIANLPRTWPTRRNNAGCCTEAARRSLRELSCAFIALKLLLYLT